MDTHKTIQSRPKLLIITAGDDLNATIRNSDDVGIIVRVDLLPENEASLSENIETILKNYASMKNIGWMVSFGCFYFVVVSTQWPLNLCLGPGAPCLWYKCNNLNAH